MLDPDIAKIRGEVLIQDGRLRLGHWPQPYSMDYQPWRRTLLVAVHLFFFSGSRWLYDNVQSDLESLAAFSNQCY